MALSKQFFALLKPLNLSGFCFSAISGLIYSQFFMKMKTAAQKRRERHLVSRFG